MSNPVSDADRKWRFLASFDEQLSCMAQLRRIAPVLVVAVVGGVASFAIFALLRDLESHRTKSILERHAIDQWVILQNTVTSELHVTGTLRAFVDTSTFVSRDQFRRFTLPHLERQKSLKSLSWIPRVAHEKRDEYEAAARADGLAEFQTSERESQGNMVPAAERGEYFPVYYIEPMKGNDVAVGFDLASSPRRLAALKHARDTGRQVATAKITPVQAVDRQPAFHIFDPVYEGGDIPSSVTERRQKLKGYIRAVVRIADLVESTAQTDAAGMQLRITDVTDSAAHELLFQSGVAEAGEEEFRFVKNLSVAGRTWRVVITPRAIGDDLHSSLKSWMVLALSVLLTGAFSIYVHLLSGASDRARQQVELKTAALKESENSLERYVRDLQDANADLERFACVASHDLQEPLRKLQQFTVFLEEDCGDELSEQASYFLDVIRRSSHRMSRLNSDLLSYSRTANRDLSLITVDLAELVDSLLCESDIPVYDPDIKITTRSLPIIRGDRAAVERLFTNLIGNAIKFRDPERLLEINIQGIIQDIDGALELRVEDNGIGFDAELRERIIEPFQCLHGVNEYAGAGIGLAICSSICKRHGWELGIDSEVGKGSTFSVFIPADVAGQAGG